MRATAARVGIVVAALAVAASLYFPLEGRRGESATAGPHTSRPAVATQSVSRSSTTSLDGAAAATRRDSAKRPTPKIQRIWVRGGKVAGGVRRLEFKRGDIVRFAVHSTVRDEVHIHGFEVTKAVPAHRIVPFAFRANIEGVFEVELHGAHAKIAELRIMP